MSRIRGHLSFANVVSLMALIFSMSGGALAAHHFLHYTHHYTITSTSQISPKVLRKLKGETGEIGPAGPQGPTGEAGPKGSNGGRGEPAPSILASGASESGVFAMRGAGGSKVPLAEGITFRIPLAVALPASQVIFTQLGKPVANCQGPGLAGKGYLCIYYAVRTLVGEEKTFNVEGIPPTEGAGRLGFTLEVLASEAAAAYEGTYTLTAP